MKYLLEIWLSLGFPVKSISLHAASCLFNAAEFPVPQFLDVLKHTDGAAPPEHPDHQLKVKNQHQNQQSPDNKQHATHAAGTNIILPAASVRDS